ncbi:MAG TPA: NUDIX hydrolase [Acidimicrobiia bacterium]|nr:NUDIX hydrolase [Acidimicrobiia bacterium]
MSAPEDAAAVPPIPAATVVLVRDAPVGLETLMLHRNSKGAFGGMWVFPGGRVDAEDAAGARDEQEAARRAAVREAFEESGLRCEPSSLVPFSHWVPPPIAPKRYATWFFIAPAPSGAVTVDGGEIHDSAWMRPNDALARRDAGEIELAPPTWMTLRHLTAFADTGAAVAEAGRREPTFYVTHMGRGTDGMVAMWAGDAGYESGDADAPGPRHRLHISAGTWALERTLDAS